MVKFACWVRVFKPWLVVGFEVCQDPTCQERGNHDLGGHPRYRPSYCWAGLLQTQIICPLRATTNATVVAFIPITKEEHRDQARLLVSEDHRARTFK